MIFCSFFIFLQRKVQMCLFIIREKIDSWQVMYVIPAVVTYSFSQEIFFSTYKQAYPLIPPTARSSDKEKKGLV